MNQPSRSLNVLWLIDHVCYDGGLHGGGRLFMNLMPRFDPKRVRVYPYFLRASNEAGAVRCRETSGPYSGYCQVRSHGTAQDRGTVPRE